jgi:hypothetical protein
MFSFTSWILYFILFFIFNGGDNKDTNTLDTFLIFIFV